jgi:hypothetical protein
MFKCVGVITLSFDKRKNCPLTHWSYHSVQFAFVPCDRVNPAMRDDLFLATSITVVDITHQTWKKHQSRMLWEGSSLSCNDSVSASLNFLVMAAPWLDKFSVCRRLSLNRFGRIMYQLMRAVERHATDRRIEPAGKGCANNASLGPT